MTAAEKRLLHSMLAEGCGVTELFAVIDAMLEVRDERNIREAEVPKLRSHSLGSKSRMGR